MWKKMLFGVVVAGVCMYYVFRGISIQQTVESLRSAHLRWIALAMFIYFWGYILRTWRWKILMGPIQAASAASLFNPLVIGFFANNVLPFRMGELVRAHITGRKFKISRTASLGTILLERICDTISFLSTFVVAAFFFSFPKNAERGAALMAAACFFLIAGLFLGIRYQTSLNRWIDASALPPRWKARLHHLTENFIQGVSGIHDMSYVMGAMFLSLIIWTIEGTTIYFITKAFPIAFSYPEAFFLLFFLGLSVTLPQAPGYVGTLELFGVTALGVLGFPKDQALPVILTIHGSQFAFIVILGFICLWREGLTVRGLVEREASPQGLQ